MRRHYDGDFPHGADFNAVAVDALQGTAISDGCLVDDGGTNDMSLSVAAGTARINDNRVGVSSQSVTLDAADGSYDRYDLVVVGTDGVAQKVTGTPASTPAAPQVPTDHVVLAVVYVQAGVSGVTDADIKDARAVFPKGQFVTSKREFAVNRRLSRR